MLAFRRGMRLYLVEQRLAMPLEWIGIRVALFFEYIITNNMEETTVKTNEEQNVSAIVENKEEANKSKWKNMLMGRNISIKALLIVIAVGVWASVLQNAGVIPSVGKQVYVVGGDIDANVSGAVDVRNTVDVDVQNQVSVDIERVLGYPIGCHKSYTINGREYQAIDVFKSNW